MSGALHHASADGLDGRSLEGARRTDLSRIFGGPRPAPVPGWLRDGARSLGSRVARLDAARAIPGALPAGTRIGRWIVERPLGAGGQGIVYLAHRMGAPTERAAVKVPRSEVSERLMREARILGRLDHPRIVRLVDASFEGSSPYLAMELHAGGSLADAIAALRERGHGAALTPERIVAIAAGVLEALAYAHERGVVHRDVKPANIFFTEDARVLVGDFGIGMLSLAKAAEAGAAGGAHPSGPLAPSLVAPASLAHTRALGTPAYMAPEQEDPARAPPGGIDGRADLFALGKALYEAITLRSPRTVRPVSLDRTDLPKGWDGFIFRLVEDRPEDRFPSAAAAQEALVALARSAAFPGGAGASSDGALRGDARGVIFRTQAEAASVSTEAYARGYQDALAARKRAADAGLGPDAPATREDVQDAVREAVRSRPTPLPPPPPPPAKPIRVRSEEDLLLATLWAKRMAGQDPTPTIRRSLRSVDAHLRTVFLGGDVPAPLAWATILLAIGFPVSVVRFARAGDGFDPRALVLSPSLDSILFLSAVVILLRWVWAPWRRLPEAESPPPSEDGARTAKLTPPPSPLPRVAATSEEVRRLVDAAETERIR